MRRLLAIALVLGLAGCYATATPYGITIEPLADVTIVGPPVVVTTGPPVAVQPLPPVYVVPDRRVYYYNSAYYYYWGDTWYWGQHYKGPWHRLDRKYWPSRMEPRGGGHDDHGRGRGRGHD
jgi:hypothetical protein